MCRHNFVLQKLSVCQKGINIDRIVSSTGDWTRRIHEAYQWHI